MEDARGERTAGRWTPPESRGGWHIAPIRFLWRRKLSGFPSKLREKSEECNKLEEYQHTKNQILRKQMLTWRKTDLDNTF